jgi:hypothetical protein
MPYCKWLAGDFIWQREQFLRQEPVRDHRAADGTPLLDGKDIAGRSLLFARPGLTPDFTLAMKHDSLYTALLQTLVKFNYFKIIAIIRHPLDVIASWQKLDDFPIGRGRPPGIARFWPKALAIADSGAAPLDRMVQLYDLYLERYHELREHITIIKYEDVMQGPMLVSELFGIEILSAAAPMLQPRRGVHRSKDMDAIRKSFRKYGVFTKLYYEDVCSHIPE